MSYFMAEAVTEGHPDAMADCIGDEILDALLREDPYSRAGIEITVAAREILVRGQVTGPSVDIPTIARWVLTDAGYDGDAYDVSVGLTRQTSGVAGAVDRSYEARVQGSTDPGDQVGASDNAFVFGYACNETDVLMPLPSMVARQIAERLAQVRRRGTIPWLGPDGKVLVVLEYDGWQPLRVDHIAVSCQHLVPARELEGVLKPAIAEHVVEPVLRIFGLDYDSDRLHVNLHGDFEEGGTVADGGVLGRKQIASAFGGHCHHGGGAISGKDPTKVDRWGAYAARWMAKGLVAAGLADRVELSIGYAIGRARPLRVNVETFGTENTPLAEVHAAVDPLLLRPGVIVEGLDLRRPIYGRTARRGHFGFSDPDDLVDITWENTK